MQYVYNDGGRAAAGFRGTTGDCVARAVAIVAGLPYAEVYAYIQSKADTERPTKRGRTSNARAGVFTSRKWFRDWLQSLGFVWVPTMAIGSGCKVHLRADELPAGRLIVKVSKHLTAVVDGVIHDNHNPSERGSTVYSANSRDVPLGASKLDSGQWVYAPERCVYGYWHRPG